MIEINATQEALLLARNLDELQIGGAVFVTDAHHKGTTIVRDSKDSYACVSLESKGHVDFCDRLLLIEGNKETDPDQSGLNRACVACDLSTEYGLWIVDADTMAEDDIPDLNGELMGGTLVWDSSIN